MIYVRLDFKNCGLSYDYTIVPWKDALEYIDAQEDEFDCDGAGFKEWEENGWLPEIKITLVNMSDSEYEEWFKKHIEPTA